MNTMTYWNDWNKIKPDMGRRLRRFIQWLAVVAIALVCVNPQQGYAAAIYNMPTLQQLSKSRVVITWLTDVDTGTTKVEYGTTTSLGTSKTGNRTLEIEVAADNDPRYLNRVSLTGLSSDTKYYYRVYTDGTDLLDSDRSFTTPPSLTSSASFDFMVIGDYGANPGPKPHKNDLRDIMEDDVKGLLVDTEHGTATYDAPRLLFTVGDNAYSDGEWEEWDDWVFSVYGEVFSRVGVVPAMGDHEYTEAENNFDTHASYPDQFHPDYLPRQFDLFDLPDFNGDETVFTGYQNTNFDLDGHFYSFNAGNAHFVIIDSEYAYSDKIYYHYSGETSGWVKNDVIDEIDEWIADDLTGLSGQIDWIFVFGHRPPWGANNGRSAWGDRLYATFEDKNVDFSFGGDNHRYERSYPMNDETPKAAGDPYPVYIITGSSAAVSTACPSGTPNWVAASACGTSGPDYQDAHYTRVHIDENCIELSTIDHEGTTIDTYDYCK